MRSRLLHACLVAPLLSCTTFSSSATASSTDAGTDPFVGSWSCTTTGTTHFTAPTLPDVTGTSTATTTVTDDGQGHLTSTTDDPDGGPSCALKSVLGKDGNSATLLAGQSCVLGGLTITYTSGTSTVNADGTRSFQSQWTFDGATMAGVHLAGNGSGAGTCKKE
jgi:hypothetical protein